MDHIELSKTNSRFRRQCIERATRSSLPSTIKDTLLQLLYHIGSATQYTLSWPSHKKIAATLGKHPGNIKKHVRRILKSRLLHVRRLTTRDARELLKAKHNHNLKGAWDHRQNFYSINEQHGFWFGDPLATQEVLDELRQEAARGGRKRLERERRRFVNRIGTVRENRIGTATQDCSWEETDAVTTPPVSSPESAESLCEDNPAPQSQEGVDGPFPDEEDLSPASAGEGVAGGYPLFDLSDRVAYGSSTPGGRNPKEPHSLADEGIVREFLSMEGLLALASASDSTESGGSPSLTQEEQSNIEAILAFLED